MIVELKLAGQVYTVTLDDIEEQDDFWAAWYEGSAYGLADIAVDSSAKAIAAARKAESDRAEKRIDLIRPHITAVERSPKPIADPKAWIAKPPRVAMIVLAGQLPEVVFGSAKVSALTETEKNG